MGTQSSHPIRMASKTATSRSLTNWSFTQIGGGEGTRYGEWIEVSSFPTTVHVELLKLKKIPDPVSTSLNGIPPLSETSSLNRSS